MVVVINKVINNGIDGCEPIPHVSIEPEIIIKTYPPTVDEGDTVAITWIVNDLLNNTIEANKLLWGSDPLDLENTVMATGTSIFSASFAAPMDMNLTYFKVTVTVKNMDYSTGLYAIVINTSSSTSGDTGSTSTSV